MPKLSATIKKNLILFSLFIFLSLYLMFTSLSNYIFFMPKILILWLIVIIVTIIRRLKAFLADWSLFIAFLYLFDTLRGSIYFLICKFNLPVYTLYVIKIEKFLFGCIPSVVLQNQFLKENPTNTFTIFEKLITVIHGSHFIVFLFVGFIIWFYRNEYFRFFKFSFFLVISLGLIGYFSVPTVPPWLASELFNIIPPLTHFNMIIYNKAIPDITSGFDVNPVAAMPSLHAAFPILCCLILWKIFRWRVLAFFFYSFLMLFSIVYTGDHYVVDIIAGIVLAVLSYSLAIKKIQNNSDISKHNKITEITKGKYLRNLIASLYILTIGFIIGFYNWHQLYYNSKEYNLYAVKYVDFLNYKKRFESNYKVQYYFGCYYFIHQNYEDAIFHFERTLRLSKDDSEKAEIMKAIKTCKKQLIKSTQFKKN